MNKNIYLNIRRNLNLELKESAFTQFFFIDLCIWTSIAAIQFYFKDSLLNLMSVPLLSILMFRNFSLMHDASHGAISKNKKLNNAVGIFSGAISGLPFEPWQRVHLEHHYWSGNVDKDPVMALMRTYNQWPKWLQSFSTACWKAWVPLLAVFQYCIFWFHSSLQLIKKPSFMGATSVLFPVLFWSPFLFYPHFFLATVLPAAVLYLIAVEVINFPHHIGLPQYRDDHRLMLWEQHEIARSCLYPEWIAKFIVLNFNYHIEHHMFPDAPWYRLSQIHEVLKKELNQNYNTDPQFQWILNNRQKKLKDLLITPATTYERKIAG